MKLHLKWLYSVNFPTDLIPSLFIKQTILTPEFLKFRLNFKRLIEVSEQKLEWYNYVRIF